MLPLRCYLSPPGRGGGRDAEPHQLCTQDTLVLRGSQKVPLEQGPHVCSERGWVGSVSGFAAQTVSLT